MPEDLRRLCDLLLGFFDDQFVEQLAVSIAGAVLMAIMLALGAIARRPRPLAGGRKALRLGAMEIVLYGMIALWLVGASAAFIWLTPPEIQARDMGIFRWLIMVPAAFAAIFFVFVTLPTVRWDQYGVESIGPFGRHSKVRWSDVVEVKQSSSKDSTLLRARDGTKLRFVALRGGGLDLTAEAYAALARNSKPTMAKDRPG